MFCAFRPMFTARGGNNEPINTRTIATFRTLLLRVIFSSGSIAPDYIWRFAECQRDYLELSWLDCERTNRCVGGEERPARMDPISRATFGKRPDARGGS